MTGTIEEYGLTLNGFKPKPFNVITSEIETQLIAKFGQIDLNPKSVFSQIINIFAEREALLWQLGEQNYNAMYPSTAQGVSLDNVCAITGLKRLKATYSYVLAQLTVINYTTVPRDSEIIVENTTDTLFLDQEITISNESCNGITIEINDINEVATYKIILNNVEYSYDKDPLDTVYIIAEKLEEALTTSDVFNADFSVIKKDNFLTIKTKDHLKTFSCFLSEEMVVVSCSNNAYFVAVEAGDVAIPMNSAKIIKTPVSGWLSVNNLTAGILGRNTETDIDFRRRRESSLRISGSGTIEALRARLLNITGVTFVTIIENKSDVVDSNSLPPKSFKVIILGGNDEAIGQTIWLIKPIGIESVGTTVQPVKDMTGKVQSVSFSRPTKVFVYVDIKLTTTESFITDSISSIRNSVLTRIQSLSLGESLIHQSLFAPVYSVKGIVSAEIKIGKTLIETDVPSLAMDNIQIEASEIITTDLNKIIITVLP